MYTAQHDAAANDNKYIVIEWQYVDRQTICNELISVKSHRPLHAHQNKCVKIYKIRLKGVTSTVSQLVGAGINYTKSGILNDF